MNRFDIYWELKKRISLINDNDLKERVEAYISPIYLFTIKCVEDTTDKKFSELDFFNKLKSLPIKINEKLKNIKERKEKRKAAFHTIQILKPTDIILYPVEPTHLNQMLPVSSKLPKEKYLFVTDRLLIYKSLIKIGEICFFINHTQDKNIEEKQCRKNYTKELTNFIDKLVPISKIETWVAYINDLLTVHFDNLEEQTKILLSTTKPKKMIVGYDITPEGRLSTLICKELGIESICIQHGSIAGEPLDGEHIVDNYLLYGEKVKEYLTKIGNNPSILKVFGAPYLDQQNIKIQKQQIIPKLKLNASNKTILIALSGPGHCTTYHHFNLIIRSIIEFAKNHPEYNFVFKLHRKDNKRYYMDILKEFEMNIPVIEFEDINFPRNIFSWLKEVDVLITGSSTVALEAMLVECPVITIDYLNEYKDIDFIDNNCTFHVKREKEIEGMLSKILKGTDSNFFSRIQLNAKNFINQYFYSETKTTSERIADWLIQRKL